MNTDPTEADRALIPLALKFVASHAERFRAEQRELDGAMIQARQKGATLRQIAEAAGLSHQTVANRLSQGEQ